MQVAEQDDGDLEMHVMRSALFPVLGMYVLHSLTSSILFIWYHIIRVASNILKQRPAHNQSISAQSPSLDAIGALDAVVDAIRHLLQTIK